MRHARGLGRLYSVLGDADYGGSMAHAGAAYRSELADIVRQPQRIGAINSKPTDDCPQHLAEPRWQAKKTGEGVLSSDTWRSSIASKCPPDQSMH